MRACLAAVCALVCAAPAYAQSEAALREYFEGKTVLVRIDMPATQEGVDVYPDARRPMDVDRYATRMRSYGTAVRAGESILVTRVRVKEKHIEFQLGGGGYGTFGDDTSGYVYLPPAAKTTREKNLERDVKRETDPKKKREMEEELNDLRRAREREDRRNELTRTSAEEDKKRRIAEQRLRAGSRFNIRYDQGVPPGLSPDGVMRALAEYVDFPWVTAARPIETASPADARASAPARGTLRKGMTWAEAEASFGKPEKTTERAEGTLKVVTAIFTRDDQRIQAEFIEGVLIRYSVTSR